MEPGQSTLYQHIQLFGRPGRYMTRFDNDPTTERAHASYNEALLYCVYYLSTARIERERRPVD